MSPEVYREQLVAVTELNRILKQYDLQIREFAGTRWAIYKGGRLTIHLNMRFDNLEKTLEKILQ